MSTHDGQEDEGVGVEDGAALVEVVRLVRVKVRVRVRVRVRVGVRLGVRLGVRVRVRVRVRLSVRDRVRVRAGVRARVRPPRPRACRAWPGPSRAPPRWAARPH